MNALHMVVWIVGIVMAAHVIERTLKYRSDQNKQVNLDEETGSRLVELEDRVRVLERIVTENRMDLKSEIDKL